MAILPHLLPSTDAMHIPAFLRTTTFRIAASFALMFSLSAILLFMFIYWQTAARETARIDQFLRNDAAAIGRESEEDIARAVAQRNLGDLHRITYAALFAADGRLLVGNVAKLPLGLPIDGQAHPAEGMLAASEPPDPGAVRVVASRLPGGQVLLVGRNVDAVHTLGGIVLNALELGVIPALLLSMTAGAFVSWRAQQRVKVVHQSAERILYGKLRERLPVHGTDDDFDRLARGVNLMLDEIGRLLDGVKGAGNDIARDLRTPLIRLRDRLSRAKEDSLESDALRAIVGDAIVDLDRTLAMITTLLRIGEIDAGRRHARAESVDLTALVEEVGQIYQPLAEDAGIEFTVALTPGLTIAADRGLMLEAVANLVQNAIKFTPAGGAVGVAVLSTAKGPAVRISDTGPGIPESRRDLILARFQRRYEGKGAQGGGLGLSLVGAIVRFHGFSVTLRDAEPGCVFEIVCRPGAPSDGRSRAIGVEMST